MADKNENQHSSGQIKKDLEDAKIAARNVYEDLLVEKEELANAKAKEEALLNGVPGGVLAIDLEGRIVRMNKAAKELLGWSESELLGKDFSDYFKLADERGNPISSDAHPFQKALTTTTTTTLFLIRKGGIKIPIILVISTVVLAGKVAGLIGGFRDITREREIEKLRSDFLALASHQLRTPLSGTKWLIETMRRRVLGPVTKKQEEYLDNIYQINERMIKLVFDMLNVLRLESAVTEMKKKTFTINEIIKDLLLRAETVAEARHVAIRVPSDRRELSIQTDFEAVKSILECFLSNAINYSHPGQEIILDIKEEPGEIIFSIKDQGIGIPKDEQKKIFERFYRAANAKGFKPDGTGLGLYMATMLAERIGVKISFESEEGKGSVFYLRVPKTPRGENKVENNKIVKITHSYE